MTAAQAFAEPTARRAPKPEGYGQVRPSDLRALVSAGIPLAFRHVWVALEALLPPTGRRVSRATVAETAGVHRRTARRAIDAFEEKGLVAVERTLGGAHANTNHLRLLGRPKEHFVSTAEALAPDVAPAARPAARPAAVVPTEVPAAVVEALRDLLGDVDHYSPGALRELAAYYGLDVPPNVPTTAIDPDADTMLPVESAEAAAVRMIREFHQIVRGDAYGPLQKELVVARGLLREHGAGAWALVNSAIASLAEHLRRSGTPVYSFLYLRPHLRRVGATWEPAETRPPPAGR